MDTFADEADIIAPSSLRRPTVTGTTRRASKNDVASSLNMGGEVTPRSIAYAAIMVCPDIPLPFLVS